MALIVVGLLAFIWQQFDADNPFARWRNPGARSLTGDQFKGLLISGLSQGSMYGLIAPVSYTHLTLPTICSV